MKCKLNILKAAVFLCRADVKRNKYVYMWLSSLIDRHCLPFHMASCIERCACNCQFTTVRVRFVGSLHAMQDTVCAFPAVAFLPNTRAFPVFVTPACCVVAHGLKHTSRSWQGKLHSGSLYFCKISAVCKRHASCCFQHHKKKYPSGAVKHAQEIRK